MTAVKKDFVALVELLEANKGKKVSTIMDQVLELATTKTNTKTFLKDDEGNVSAIYCYYHKKWEPLSEVEYGAKKSSSHGFNTMCKEGANRWSKQQRDAKKGRDELLNLVAKGEVEDLQAELTKLDEAKAEILPREDNVGFDTLEEVHNYVV